MKDLDKSKRNTNLVKEQKEIIERIRERSKSAMKEVFLKIPFRCSKKGKEFIVYLKEGEIDELYKVDRILTEDDLSHSGYNLSSSAENKGDHSEEDEININKINIEELKCPYCGNKGIIKCGCGKLSCAGGIKEDLHKCPWCESEGYIEGTFDTVSGEKSKERKFIEERERKMLAQGGINDILDSGN